MTPADLQRIADRAGTLAAKTVKELRLLHPDNLDGTTSGAQWAALPKTRLIADIIFDEFEPLTEDDQ